MKKPDKVYPSSPTSTRSPMPLNIQDPALSGVSFDQLLQNRGIRMIHRVATHCPNMSGIEENSHSPTCSVCDNAGIYYPPELQREIWGVFVQNSLEKIFEIQGVWDIGTAVVTLPTEYPMVDSNGNSQVDIDGNAIQADFGVYDQIICPDFEVRLNDLKEYEPTTDNTQKLRYPIVRIDALYSVVNNAVKKYIAGTDYNIVNGEIQWIVGRTPAYDALNDKGEVLSITYLANPVYTFSHSLHEMRVTQTYDVATGTKVAMRLPQNWVVKRDFLFNSPDKEGE